MTAGRPGACRALGEDAMVNTSQVAVGAVNKRLGALSFIAGSAPLLGMLGTVTGMISAFAGWPWAACRTRRFPSASERR